MEEAVNHKWTSAGQGCFLTLHLNQNAYVSRHGLLLKDYWIARELQVEKKGRKKAQENSMTPGVAPPPPSPPPHSMLEAEGRPSIFSSFGAG
jgi:hypothetical protein